MLATKLRFKKSIEAKGNIIVITIISILLLSQTALSDEAGKFKPELEINLMGGYRSINIGDLNTYLKSFDKFLTETTDYQGDQIKALHHFPEIGLALSWNLSSRVAVDFGLEFISQKKRSSFGLTEDVLPSPYYQEYYIEQKVKVWPLTLRGCYLALASPEVNLSVDLGLTYSFSRCHLNIWESSPVMPPPTVYSLKAHGPGLVGGIYLEHKLNSFLALGLEAQGRYSKLARLEGSTTGTEDEGQGFLYIGEKYNSQSDRYEPYLITSSSMPAGDEFRKMRKASLDLSGFSLKLGLKIRLF